MVRGAPAKSRQPHPLQGVLRTRSADPRLGRPSVAAKRHILPASGKNNWVRRDLEKPGRLRGFFPDSVCPTGSPRSFTAPPSPGFSGKDAIQVEQPGWICPEPFGPSKSEHSPARNAKADPGQRGRAVVIAVFAIG